MKILIVILSIIFLMSEVSARRYKHRHRHIIKTELVPLPKERLPTFEDVWNERGYK